MVIRNSHLSEEYCISSIISGLKDAIKTMVRMLKPAALSEAFEMSTLRKSFNLQSRNSKDSWKAASDNRFGISRSSSQQQNNNSYYKVLSVSVFKNTQFKGKPVSTTEPKSRKISTQEIQYRRNNGLCFRCGENLDKAISSNLVILIS